MYTILYLQNANRAFKKFSSWAITIKTTLKKKRFEKYIAKENETKRRKNKNKTNLFRTKLLFLSS